MFGRLRGLTGRVLLLVGLGTAALLAVLGAVSLYFAQEATRRSLDQRLDLARAAAAYVEAALQGNLAALQQVAAVDPAAPGGPPPAVLQASLHALRLRTVFTRRVALVDAAGRVLAADPAGATEPPGGDWLRGVLADGRPAVSGAVRPSPAGPSLVFAAVPVSRNGRPAGALVGEIDLDGPALADLVAPLRPGPGGYADLVDGRGVVLASTRAGRVGAASDHEAFLAARIRERKAQVSACHGCHAAAPIPEVMALAPVAVAGWGIALREPEAEVLALPARVRRAVLAAGGVFLGIGLVLAWGMARGVVGPVRRLTACARRIAAGDLGAAIPPGDGDEIAELARSLAAMRDALGRHLAEARAWTAELERRVQDRTAALEATARALRQKEEARGELLRKLITAQEEERKRIARELHDETSQVLAALALGLEGVAAAPLADAAREKLRGLRAQVVAALDGVHRIIHLLRPAALDDLGLVSAIRWTAETVLEPRGLQVDFAVRGDEARLPPAVEIALFRAAQEAITNVARHADADRATLTLTFGRDAVEVCVEDDGKGFDPAEASRGDGAGLGLLGMRERMALLEGTAEVVSRPGEGTRVTLRVPRGAGAAHG